MAMIGAPFSGRVLAGTNVLVERDECGTEAGRVLADPTAGHLLDRHGVQEVPLYSADPNGDHEVRRLQHTEVFHHAEPAHLLEPVAQLTQGLAIELEQRVQQAAAGRIGERLENVGPFLHDADFR